MELKGLEEELNRNVEELTTLTCKLMGKKGKEINSAGKDYVGKNVLGKAILPIPKEGQNGGSNSSTPVLYSKKIQKMLPKVELVTFERGDLERGLESVANSLRYMMFLKERGWISKFVFDE